MPEAYIYDHVRTPRGRGKPDGSLHEVTALRLAETALRALAQRNDLDTAKVDDVVLGCVDPVGEAGGDIARAAALVADYGNHVPGVQINRYLDAPLLLADASTGRIRISGIYNTREVKRLVNNLPKVLPVAPSTAGSSR